MSVVLPRPAVSGTEHWLAAFREIAPSLPGAALPWLGAIRQGAITRFADSGWPSNRLENWRHTSLAFLDKETFTPVPDGTAARTPGIRALVEQLRVDDDAGHWLVFVDGRFAPKLSRLGVLPAGVELGTLSEALASAPQRLESLFGDAGQGEVTEALNAALAADGAVIRLADGAVLEEPIHLVFIAVSSGAAIQPRNLVAAGAGTQATIVEHYLGHGEAAADVGTLTNAVTRIDAGADSRITHVKLQQEALGAIHLAVIDAMQARGSMFTSHSMSFGARLARNDIATRFDGEGCEVLLNGLYHVDGRRHVDHHTRIDHAQPRGTSREFYRGIMDDAGRGVFSGRILVAPGAARTDAVQRTDSLLLSPKAETDARPELEIYADDVKCAHGATVGQIDEASLFYLRSRGLDEAHARNILTYAFAVQALARIDLAPLRMRAEAAVRSRLPGGESMEMSW